MKRNHVASAPIATLLVALCVCSTPLASLFNENANRVQVDQEEPQEDDEQDTLSEPEEPSATPTPVPEPPAWYETVVDPPHYRRDLWAIELGLIPESQVEPPRSATELQVGDTVTLTYVFTNGNPATSVETEVRYVTDHVYMLFERGTTANPTDIARVAETFENDIYPTTRRVFGEEPSPGIDGDPHVFLVHLSRLRGNIYGGIQSEDQCHKSICLNSNQAEIIYLSLAFGNFGSDFYLGSVAHEFLHLVESNVDGNEQLWIEEPIAVLNEGINKFGFGRDEIEMDYYRADPNVQLNMWITPFNDTSPDFRDSRRQFVNSTLFVTYLYEQFGEEFIRNFWQSPLNGFAPIQAELDKVAPGTTVEDVVGTWSVANWIDDPSLDDGQYGYNRLDMGRLSATTSHSVYPVEETRTMRQYSANYIVLSGLGDVTITFDGAKETHLLPSAPPSGDGFWWSGRHEDSSLTLRRTFLLDTTALSNPRLQAKIWYDMRDEIDRAALLVSSDGGNSWSVQGGQHTRHTEGGQFFDYYTGMSGDGTQPSWLNEEFDLSRWEGDRIMVQLYMITSAAHPGMGLAIDDVRLVGKNPSGDEVIVLEQDFEENDGGWEGVGFAHAQNTLPQNWSVYMIEQGAVTRVHPVLLDENNHGEINVSIGGDVESAVLIIVATAPYTLESASYSYTVETH